MSENTFLKDAAAHVADEVFGGERNEEDAAMVAAAYAYIGLTPEQAQALRDDRASVVFDSA